MRTMDNAPQLPAAEVVEIIMRVIETRNAVSEHQKSCSFCRMHG